jgi:hypothetical protein
VRRAPENVEIVNCPPGDVDVCDSYVIHNCVQYTVDDLEPAGLPTVKYWHDVGSWVHPDVRTGSTVTPVCLLLTDPGRAHGNLDEAH